MSYHRVKATSMTSGTSLCHPRDPSPTRTCLSSPQHLFRSQHCQCSVLGKSCSPLHLAQGPSPLLERFLLSLLHRCCNQQVSVPALFLCKNTCPPDSNGGMGCPSDPLWHVSLWTLLPASTAVIHHLVSTTLAQTWSHACPGAVHENCAVATLNRRVLVFGRPCPKQQVRAAAGRWQCCHFLAAWENQLHLRFLRYTSVVLWFPPPWCWQGPE